ncbi:hypothetical protein ABEG18_01905 [Alsobacter sp. KACC 23698]|uniref:Uncharacterized protein n=1 Tax=Alsobacter sp. KACC 23698 TaxID=3149229 RepID=A0AAU7JHU4_9HYPH
MSTLHAAAAAGLIVPALTFALVLMVAQAKDNAESRMVPVRAQRRRR